ncbi:MAG TPA: hypothetical protein VFC76_02295 [Oscillospiraceae bacterium]|nr:hypothetical protein [Oscillospiraceae bacterium]
MKYKEICSKHIADLMYDLLNDGMPMLDVISLIVRLCDTAVSFLEDK